MTNNSYQTAARVRERTHALRKGAPWQLESRRHGSQMYLRCVIGQAAIDGDENGKKRHRTGSNVSTIPRRVAMGTAAHQPAIFEGTRVRTSRRIRTGLPASLPACLPAPLVQFRSSRSFLKRVVGCVPFTAVRAEGSEREKRGRTAKSLENRAAGVPPECARSCSALSLRRSTSDSA